MIKIWHWDFTRFNGKWVSWSVGNWNYGKWTALYPSTSPNMTSPWILSFDTLIFLVISLNSTGGYVLEIGITTSGLATDRFLTQGVMSANLSFLGGIGFPAFAKNTYFILLLTSSYSCFIIDYVMHGRPIFFVLPRTITLIYDYFSSCVCD